MPTDAIGSFDIPANLLERIKNAPAPAPVVEAEQIFGNDVDPDDTSVIRFGSQWTVVKRIPASKGSAVHTVSARRMSDFNDGEGYLELKCTCQGFRISGQGIECKHTKQVRDEL